MRIDTLKRFVRTNFPKIWVLIKGNKFLFARESYLNSVGYIESIKQGRPCAADGSALPWMNYAVIAFLEDKLSRDFRLFEYGCGSSTLYFAKRVEVVFSVEHDVGWYRELAQQTPSNVTLIHCAIDLGAAYEDAICHCGINQFDVIVIDGARRGKCAKVAPAWLSTGGVIIFDDSDREEWRSDLADLRSLGFRQLKLKGLKPTGYGSDETSIFYRDNNCLGL